MNEISTSRVLNMFKERVSVILMLFVGAANCNAEVLKQNSKSEKMISNGVSILENRSKKTNILKFLANDIQGIDLTVSEKLFGEYELSKLSLSNSSDVGEIQNSGTIKVIEKGVLSSPASGELMRLIVLAKVQEGKGAEDIAEFKQAEKPYIDKFDGKVVYSLYLDSKKTGWDLVEVVEFKDVDAFFSMMEDPAYKPGGKITKLSEAIFAPKTSAYISQ